MKKIAMIMALLLLLAGCAAHNPEGRTVYAMDTVMDLTVWGEDQAVAADALQLLIRELEERWSATDSESVLSQMNEDEAVLNWEDRAFLEQVEALHQRTDGAFDPMLHNAVSQWGFMDGQYRVPSQKELEAALAEKKWNLGAVVKGYTGRRAVQLLQTMNVDRAILNLGGNVQTYGQKADGTPWIIGIQNPRGGNYVGTVSVSGTMAVVTSGDYQRYFEKDGVRYHHILNPETGMPAENGLASVTVICKDGVVADALSTAMYVMGLERASEFWAESDDFEAVFIDREGKIYATEGANLSGCEFEVIRREN